MRAIFLAVIAALLIADPLAAAAQQPSSRPAQGAASADRQHSAESHRQVHAYTLPPDKYAQDPREAIAAYRDVHAKL